MVNDTQNDMRRIIAKCQLCQDKEPKNLEFINELQCRSSSKNFGFMQTQYILGKTRDTGEDEFSRVLQFLTRERAA
jgi:hypothetical protein